MFFIKKIIQLGKIFNAIGPVCKSILFKHPIMKNLFNIFIILMSLSFFSFLEVQAQNGTKSVQQIQLDGHQRSFIVYTPSTYTGEKAVAMVFMFHGTGGDGEKFYNISGWKEKAEQEGFIAVFPSALAYCYIDDDGSQKRKSKWNDKKLLTYICPGEQPADDIAFVREMISLISQKRNIDPQRIYASGFSNGGNFVSHLAVSLNDQIAAIAAVGGGMGYSLNEVAKVPVSAYLMAGRIDDRLTSKNNGQPLPVHPDSLMQSIVYPQIQAFTYLLQLEESFTPRVRPWHTTMAFNTSKNGADNVFIFSSVKGLQHRYPNGRNNPAGLKAAKVFWEFFEKHPLTITP